MHALFADVPSRGEHARVGRGGHGGGTRQHRSGGRSNMRCVIATVEQSAEHSNIDYISHIHMMHFCINH